MANENFVEHMLKSAEKKQEKLEPQYAIDSPQRDSTPVSKDHEMTKEEIENVENFAKNLRKGTTE